MERVKYVVDFSEMMKNICAMVLFVLQDIRSQEMAILLASDGGVISTPYLARVTHTQTLFCVCLKSALLRHFSKESSSQARFMSHAQCSWLDRIPFPLPHSTPSPLYPLNGSISCNPQQGVPFGRLAEQSPTTRARRRVSLVLVVEVSTEA